MQVTKGGRAKVEFGNNVFRLRVECGKEMSALDSEGFARSRNMDFSWRSMNAVWGTRRVVGGRERKRRIDGGGRFSEGISNLRELQNLELSSRT